MAEPRIVSPAEARAWIKAWSPRTPRHQFDLAHTAVVLGEQREAVLALHWLHGDGQCVTCCKGYPCPTARALGVTAEPEPADDLARPCPTCLVAAGERCWSVVERASVDTPHPERNAKP